VERAAGLVLAPRLLQRHATGDQLDDIRARDQLIDEGLWNPAAHDSRESSAPHARAPRLKSAAFAPLWRPRGVLGQLGFDPRADRTHVGAALGLGLDQAHDLAHVLDGTGTGARDRLADQRIQFGIRELRRQVVAAFQKHKTPLNMGVELPSLEAVKRFVAMGNGVALVPGLTVGRELASGELVQVPVEALRFERHLRLVHRKRANLSHAAIAFLKVVRSLSLERGAPYEFRVERTG